MSKPQFHAQSSARRYGGKWEDYMEIHEFMDSSKAAFPDNRHRALTHNSWFIGTVLPRVFGETFKRKSDKKIVNTRDIGEQHVLEDYKMRFIPTVSDFLAELEFLPWMQNALGEPPHSHKKIDKRVKKDTPQRLINTLPDIEAKKVEIPMDDIVFDGKIAPMGGITLNDKNFPFGESSITLD